MVLPSSCLGASFFSLGASFFGSSFLASCLGASFFGSSFLASCLGASFFGSSFLASCLGASFFGSSFYLLFSIFFGIAFKGLFPGLGIGIILTSARILETLNVGFAPLLNQCLTLSDSTLILSFFP